VKVTGARREEDGSVSLFLDTPAEELVSIPPEQWCDIVAQVAHGDSQAARLAARRFHGMIVA
jgi:hypothetical protein